MRTLMWLLGMVCSFGLSIPAYAQCGERWLPGQGAGGIENSASALIRWDPDGELGPRLLVAGGFDRAAEVYSPNLAVWDGESWSAFGADTPSVITMGLWNNRPVIASYFEDPEGEEHSIAEWDGTAWNWLPGRVDGMVSSICEFQGQLYIAGYFTHVGNVQANRIARWDGHQWRALGTGCNGGIQSLVVHDGEVIAGGAFTMCNGASANRVAAWNGTTWRSMGAGIGDGEVKCLVSHGTALVAGGSFTRANNVLARRTARWNGSQWVEFGGGVASDILAMTVHEGAIVASGYGSLALSGPARYLMRFNGQVWAPIAEHIYGVTTNAVIDCFGSLGDQLIVGGFLRSVDGVGVVGVARLEDFEWHPMGNGVTSQVAALAVYEDKLVLGGDFKVAGRHIANGLAMWDGVDFYPVGGGVDDTVTALAVYNGELIVAGAFEHAGGVPANNIAAWNGQQWRALRGGVDGTVRALSEYQGELIVAGSFFEADGQVAPNVARWNGTSWARLPPQSGVGPALAVYPLGQTLYIGGEFSWGGAMQNVCRWTAPTTTLAPVGSGFDRRVRCFTSLGTQLYAGGSFSHSGQTPMNGIARWNGILWSPLGQGVHGAVYTMLFEGTDLYAFGSMDYAGGQSVRSAAIYRLGSWLPMGQGIQADEYPDYGGVVNASVRYRNEIIVAGYFDAAGGHSSSYFARWTLNGAPWIARQPVPCVSECDEPTSMSAVPAWGVGPNTFEWQVDDGGSWRQVGDGDLVVDGSVIATVSGSQSQTIEFTPLADTPATSFRCIVSNACNSVTSTPATLQISGCSSGCDPDVNCDGSPDQGDVACMILAVAGDASCICQDPDFNQDGSADQGDVAALIGVVAGQPCP